MPIRINLLAEAQAAEEQRRRDPVKRAIWMAFIAIALVLLWSSFLQARIIADNSRLGALEAKYNSRTNQYNQILSNKQRLVHVEMNLAALHRFATNRFLHAPVLNALQHATLEGIQISRLRTEQTCLFTPAVKGSTSDSGKISPGKPATSTERIKLVIDARAAGDNPGPQQIKEFKETMARTAYFQSERITTNDVRLISLAAPQYDNAVGKSYVLFNLECLYPERVR